MAQVLTEITDIENTWMGDPPECGFANYVRKHGQPMRITERTMMKTAELSGARLDYWVAKAENAKAGIHWSETTKCWWWGEDEPYSPSTKWAQGGPIIERERISVTWPEVEPSPGYEWHANIAREDASFNCRGPTPLIAAMRAYVASKFGEEVPDGAP